MGSHFTVNFLFPSLSFNQIYELELDMAEYLGTWPSFDSLEWFEFVTKHEILRAKVQKKKAGNIINLAEDFLKRNATHAL